jgi:mono/diheme cytochrome c family protein
VTSIEKTAKPAVKSVRSFAGRRVQWIGVLLTSLVLIFLPEIIKLDGKPHADWQQFLGRFHPLVVHVPIGLLVLLPILEIVGARKPALREAAGLVLTLACVACLGSLLLGYFLAFGSGETGLTLVRHLWGGITLSIGLMMCVLIRPGWTKGASRLYPAILFSMLLALVWTAHQGGSMTHGEGYLTAYMPLRMRGLFGASSTNTGRANTGAFYAKRIHPIFDAHCIACHGPSKSQGGLRLDSYEELIKGGKDGPVIVSGDPTHSLLLQRISLPADNAKVMPAEGRPLLKPEEIAVIQAWIEAGASPKTEAVAGVSNPNPPEETPAQPVSDYGALMSELAKMRDSQGPKLLPVSSKPSDGLILNTADAPEAFDDAALTRFERFAPYIVEANLARTAVTDKSFETLSTFASLRAIHLEGTHVTGSGIEKLSHLSQLSYINLSETKLSPAALTSLRSLKNLRRLYTFDTPAEPVSNPIPPHGT